MVSNYYYATGRRKAAIARVRVHAGSGEVIVNGKPLRDVFGRELLWQTILSPLRVANATDKFSATVLVSGGGLAGQAGAIAHGIARALVRANEEMRPLLRKAGLLTRDARVKERKKYGLKRARKAPQYTKR